MELFVQYTQVCVENEPAKEEYGDWYAAYDFTVKSVSTGSFNGKYRDSVSEEQFEVDFEVNPGDTLWVLSMTYSSGDSFGRSDGNGEVLWVFKDRKLAETAGDALYDHQDDWEIEFEVESGKKIKMSNPAAGYFENIGTLRVEPFVLMGV